MDGCSDHNGAYRRMAYLIYAASLVVGYGTVQAATVSAVSASLRVSARVVASCRVLTNSNASANQEMRPRRVLGSHSTTILLTTNCNKNPGSATLMAVSTESVNAHDPTLAVISRGFPASAGSSSDKVIDGSKTADRGVIDWGIHPASAQLIVSLPGDDQPGDQPPVGADRILRLVINY